MALFGKSTDPGSSVNSRWTWRSATLICLWCLISVCLVGLIVTTAYGWSRSLNVGPRFLIWSLGLLAVGLFIGFLFGLPRLIPGLPTSPAPQPSSQPPGGTTTANIPSASPAPAVSPAVAGTHGTDAMLEIADWLTKVIAGLGLVNLKSAPALMDRLAAAIACPPIGAAAEDAVHASGDHHPCDQSFALAMAVFFPTIGLMLGYLATRLFLQTALVDSDRVTRNALLEPVSPADLVRSLRREEANSLQTAGGNRLPTDGAEPDPQTRQTLASLNSQYISCSLPDYAARVQAKNDLAQQMYELAAQKLAPKTWLADQAGDGYIHVLATSALGSPTGDDAAGLLRVGASARMRHTKYRVAQAFLKLLEAQLIDREQLDVLRTLMNSYLIDADPPLASLIQLVQSKLV